MKTNFKLFSLIIILVLSCDETASLLQQQDCLGVPNGTTVEDCAGVCDGTAELDCAGVCGGAAIVDDCGLCTGGTTGVIANSSMDCAGVCGGIATTDNCGICDTNSTNNNTASTGTCDCLGTPNGTATLDNCGICDTDTTNDNTPLTGTCDCAGTPNGTATIDDCGICDNITSNNCTKDCAGAFGGSAVIDACGVCNGSGAEENHDCEGNCSIDDFDNDGICDIDESNPWGDVVYHFDNITDELAILKYTSNVDIYGFEFDVSGVVLLNVLSPLGSISLSNAGDNVLGVSVIGSFLASGTGIAATLYFEPLPSEFTLSISNIIFAGRNDELNAVELSLYGTNSTIIPACSLNTYGCCGNITTDCNGVCGGASVEDCAGVCNGVAYFDPNCGSGTSCVGGNTGLTACIQDCANTWGGSAVIDECGVCDGNNSPNTGICDCALVQNGTAYYDNCGNCVLGTTGELPCYELIFSEYFSASNQSLSQYSSKWTYDQDDFIYINISNNKLDLKGKPENTGMILDDVLISTKLIDKFEFSADFGNISFATSAWIYGLALYEQYTYEMYYFFYYPQEDGDLYWAFAYYDNDASEWIEIYDWQSISSSTYDISHTNLKLEYDENTIKGYIDNDNVFSHVMTNFQCQHYAIYTQWDGELWVDNVYVYGRQVASSYGSSMNRRSRIPKSSPVPVQSTLD